MQNLDAGTAIVVAVTVGATKLLDVIVRWRKEGRAERASVTASAHALTEDAAAIADLYKSLLEDQRREMDALLRQEREHCEQRIDAMERVVQAHQQEIEKLRARVRELEQQSGAVDVTALRVGATQ